MRQYQSTFFINSSKISIISVAKLILLRAIFLIQIDARQTLDFCFKNDCDPKVLENSSNQLYMLSDDLFIFPTNIEQMNDRCK